MLGAADAGYAKLIKAVHCKERREAKTRRERRLDKAGRRIKQARPHLRVVVRSGALDKLANGMEAEHVHLSPQTLLPAML